MDERRLTGALALYRIFKGARGEDVKQQGDYEALSNIAAALDALAADISATAHRLRAHQLR